MFLPLQISITSTTCSSVNDDDDNNDGDNVNDSSNINVNNSNGISNDDFYDDDDDGDDDDEDDIFCSEVTLQSNSCVQLTLQRAEHRLVPL